ncbi:PAP2 superfamily protein [mine drainage metagenome]|uniref:PAP2 superfamily protein n=1 Tax=mine drainage metagenome TaxID=410659 RepID=A0A1J5SBI3_9ZZZZ
MQDNFIDLFFVKMNIHENNDRVKLLSTAYFRSCFWLLCCAILMGWAVNEVRAETATNTESQIGLGPWSGFTPSSRQLDLSNEARLFTAYPPNSFRMVPETEQIQSLKKSRYLEYTQAEHFTPEVARADGVMLASSGESQPVTTHDSVFKKASNDLTELSHQPATPEFWRSVLVFGGIGLVAAIADKPLDKFAVNHGKDGFMTGVEKVGNGLPFVAIGYSAMMFLTSDEESNMGQASYNSLAAGGVGAMTALGLKYMVGRARPSAERGSASFTPMSASNGNTSWPSMHSTVMWAVITPYAKAYDAPWLYGVAAVTNVARIGGRDHWFSDTVAGSMLGYAIGNFMWESHQGEKGRAEWIITPNKIALNWNFD